MSPARTSVVLAWIIAVMLHALVVLLAMHEHPANAAREDPLPAPVPVRTMVPTWLQGEWRRDWIERNRVRSNTRAVLYLQAPVHFGDLRIPGDRGSYASAKSFADLDDAQLRMLLRQQGTVGHAKWDSMTAIWTAEIDFQPPSGDPDAGRIEPLGQDAFLERALDDTYVESWTRQAPAGPFPVE